MPQDLFLKSFSDLMGLKPYFKNKILAVEMQFLVPLSVHFVSLADRFFSYIIFNTFESSIWNYY